MENKATILIADDNEINLEIVDLVIKGLGYNTILAKDGLDAIKLLERAPVDLILLDIIMPEMDGYEVLSHLKNDSALCRIPVIVISAIDDMESIVKCIKMGAEDYLARPFNKTLLKARISACIEKKILLDQEEDYLNQIEKLLNAIQADLKLGAAIQKHFLTNESETKKTFGNIGYDVTIFNKAPSTISGDFYYPKEINLHSAGIFFADVCGHGIGAALISMRVLSIVDHLRSPIYHASEFMEMVNVDINEFMPHGHFVAANYLILNQEGFIISNASQPYPIIVSNNEVKEINLDSRPLGQDADAKFQESNGSLSSGDKIILYTDGIIEATDANGNMYGEERFYKCISEHLDCSAEEIIRFIIADVKAFAGREDFDDDVTIGVFEKK